MFAFCNVRIFALKLHFILINEYDMITGNNSLQLFAYSIATILVVHLAKKNFFLGNSKKYEMNNHHSHLSNFRSLFSLT